MTKISIILPVYNVENYIEKAIQSILEQSFQDYEVIVVSRKNAGDNSVALAQSLVGTDSRFLFIEQEGRGLSNARNRALEVVRGKYLFFMDSDDYLSPHILQSLFDEAEEKKTEILMYSFAYSNEKTGFITPPNREFSAALAQLSQNVYAGREILDIFFDLYFYAWGALYLSSFIKYYSYIFPENLTTEDIAWNFFYRVRASRISAISEVGYYYCLRKGSLSNAVGESQKNIYSILNIIMRDNAVFFQDKKLSQLFFVDMYKLCIRYHLPAIMKNRIRDSIAYAYKTYSILKKAQKGTIPIDSSLIVKKALLVCTVSTFKNIVAMKIGYSLSVSLRKGLVEFSRSAFRYLKNRVIKLRNR